MINLIYISIQILSLALIEVFYDQLLSKNFDETNKLLKRKRTSGQNKLLHEAQIPFRVLVIVPSVLMHSNPFNVFYWVFSVSFFWLVFDIFVNILWLKKPLFYWGGTSKIDLFFGKHHVWVKLLLVSSSLLKILLT